jgi:hypothetical protein
MKHSLDTGTWWLDDWQTATKNSIAVDPDGRWGIAFLSENTGQLAAFIVHSDVPQFLEAARIAYPEQAAYMEKLLAEIPNAKIAKQQMDAANN